MLEIDVVGEYLVMHGCPGQNNYVNGTVMNYLFASHQCGELGYGLMWALAPCNRPCCVAFARWFVIAAASPNYYCEAIAWYNQTNLEAIFVPQSGTHICI